MWLPTQLQAPSKITLVLFRYELTSLPQTCAIFWSLICSCLPFPLHSGDLQVHPERSPGRPRSHPWSTPTVPDHSESWQTQSIHNIFKISIIIIIKWVKQLSHHSVYDTNTVLLPCNVHDRLVKKVMDDHQGPLERGELKNNSECKSMIFTACDFCLNIQKAEVVWKRNLDQWDFISYGWNFI